MNQIECPVQCWSSWTVINFNAFNLVATNYDLLLFMLCRSEGPAQVFLIVLTQPEVHMGVPFPSYCRNHEP